MWPGGGRAAVAYNQGGTRVRWGTSDPFNQVTWKSNLQNASV